MIDFNSALYQILGERIKKRREELRLNQIELSEKVKIGRTSISNIEKGRQCPPLALIYSICYALDIDIHSLLPTYSEVDLRINFTDTIIDNYIDSFGTDKNTIEHIKAIIKRNTK